MKVKTKGGVIEFRPPLKDKDESFVEDELVAQNASVHVEQMDDDHWFMSIATEKDNYGFDFFVGEEITTEEGKKTRELKLRAWKMA